MADGAGTVCIHRVTRGASKDRTAPRKWFADRRQRAEGNPPPTAKPRRGGNRYLFLARRAQFSQVFAVRTPATAHRMNVN